MDRAHLIVGVIALVASACGAGDPKTPEAALQRLLDAAKNGDAAGFRQGFPSREELTQLFECPAGVDLTTRYDGLSEEFMAWRDARPVLPAGGLTIAKQSAVMAGEAVGGCRARLPLSLVRAEVRLSEGGADKRYAMRFVEREGKVRVLAF
jgi:hypothetical protein